MATSVLVMARITMVQASSCGSLNLSIDPNSNLSLSRSNSKQTGRIRKGPAPLNLEIPEHEFQDNILIVG